MVENTVCWWKWFGEKVETDLEKQMKLQKHIIAKARGDSGQKKKKSTRRAMCWGWLWMAQRQLISTQRRQQVWYEWHWDGGWDGREIGGQSTAIFSVQCVVTSSFEVKRKGEWSASLRREECEVFRSKSKFTEVCFEKYVCPSVVLNMNQNHAMWWFVFLQGNSTLLVQDEVGEGLGSYRGGKKANGGKTVRILNREWNLSWAQGQYNAGKVSLWEVLIRTKETFVLMHKNQSF